MDRDWVDKGGLDVLKEVLWVFVGQRAAKLWSVKLWEWSDRPGLELGLPLFRSTRAAQQDFFRPPTLTACNFATSWHTETHSTSLERSQPLLQTQPQLRGLAGFLIQVICDASKLDFREPSRAELDIYRSESSQAGHLLETSWIQARLFCKTVDFSQ